MLKTSWAVIRRFIDGSTGPAYYVASNGSDSNDGLSSSTPIQTLSKVNTLDFSTIKTVRFRRGDTFEGTITLQSSGNSSKPITYASYGSGNKPIIIGSSLITGWSLHSGNIWKATYATDINQLFVNNVRMQAARWPETGFANVDAAPTTSSLTCNALNGALNFTGVKCIIHSSSYGLETKAVTSSTGTTLTLATTPFGDVSINEKFILVGKLEFLTKPGQWYYDSATDTVYLWKLDSTQPSNVEVRGSTIDYGFVGTSKNYFAISDLEFAHQKITGINLTGCTNFTVSNNTLSYQDFKGSADLSCDFGTYYMNTVIGANSGGMSSDLSDDMTYDSNVVSNIAIFDNLGLGGVGPWYGGSGIATHGDRTSLLRNTLDTIGYNGISFHGLGTVMYNYVTNYCLTKNDGGGIYTSAPVTDGDYAYGDEQNKGSIIRYNTCLYGWGVPEIGTAYGEGIYLDESSGGVTVDYNTVGYCSGRGIFCHKGNNHTVAYNTVYKCENGLYISLVGDAIAMNNNIVYGVANQELVHLNTLSGTPVINNNTYINHYMSNPFQLNWATRYTFVDWKTTTSHDAASTIDNTAMPTNQGDNLLVNPTANSKRYYLNNATNIINDVTSNSITNYVDLAGYTSLIIKGLNVDCVLDYEDYTAPVITTFDMAANSSSATVSPLTIEATGEPTKYILTEVNTTPSLTDEGWSETPSYTFSSEGTKTLYLWARDAAGNISASASDTILIEENIYDDVVSWYEMDASGTTLVDETGNNNGTNKNASDVDYSATPVAGKLGDAYSYSGATFRYSTIPDSASLDFSKAFTIAAWTKPTTLSSARGVFGKRDGTYSEWELYINADGSVSFTLIENGNNVNRITCKTATGVVTAANWHLIVLRHDGTNRKAGFSIYVNNVLQSVTYTYSGTVTSELSTGIIHTIAPLKIATALAGAANMTGLIDQVVVWSKAISDNVRGKYWNNGDGVSYPVD